MFGKKWASVLVLTAFGLAAGARAGALGAGFTYQGQLKKSGATVNDTCNFQFSLWDSPGNGTGQQGSTQTVNGVAVTGGLLTVPLNGSGEFGGNAFTGQARWLQLGVQCTGDAGFTVLAPRQELTAAPYAQYAATAGSAASAATATTAGSATTATTAGYATTAGSATTATTAASATSANSVPWTGITGMGSGAGSGLTLTGTTFSVNTTAVQSRVTGTCSSGNAIRVINADGTVTCQEVWSTTGNSGTTAGTQFLGTTDNQPLELKVAGRRGLRLIPGTFSINVLSGSENNVVKVDVEGGTIAGGGNALNPNRVFGVFGTIGGGKGNSVGDVSVNPAHQEHATVGGGSSNTASATGSTVSGGVLNVAGGHSSSVGGGNQNKATGQYSSIPGGSFSTAAGNYSFAAGRRANALGAGSFVWADSVDADFTSAEDKPNQFLVRAGGGVGINTTTPTVNTLTVGGAGLRIATDGTTFARIQAGEKAVGASAAAFLTVTIDFPVAFATVPKIVVTPRNDPNFNNVNDTFSASIRSISTTQVVVNILRLDTNGGWSQNLRLNWIAWE